MSSGTEKININLPGMTNQEIKSSLISIYDKINKPPTKEVGYDLFLKLVHKNIYSPPQMNFIINHVSEFITPLEPKEKDPCIKLLSLIFYSPSNEEESVDSKIYFPYLSPVLTTLQNLIKDSNSPIFPTIANIFAEIVQNIMPTDIEASNIELDQEEKTAYEMMQGFCIYNMKYDQKQYMKLIWEVIMNLIDKKNFNAKYELLNCLISLILGAENLFTPYAHNTLYKVLDFLADTDWLKRKLALNVIYTLIFYCKDEILPLKEHIISFLRALKTDKVKEVREVCLLILKIFSENEPKNKDNTKDKNKANNNSSINRKKFGNRVDNKNVSKNKNSSNNTNTNSSTNKSRISIKKSGNKLNKNIDSDKNSNKFGECVVPEMRDKTSDNLKSELIKNDLNNFQENNNIKSLNKNMNKSSSELIPGFSEQENLNNTTNISTSKKTGLNSNIRTNIRESNEQPPTNQNSNKLVNRKDDKTFINEKMVIKPDPNKSIFKSSPNPAFFNQANKKSKDIVLVSKSDSQKYQNNINNKKVEENEIKIEIKEKPNDKKVEEKKENVINTNLEKNNNEIKEVKEIKEKKEVPSTKNKVAPIKRKKITAKVPEKEEKNKEKEQEEKKELNINNINKNDKKNLVNEEIEESNIVIKFKKPDAEIKDYKTYLKKDEDDKNKVNKKESEKINYDSNIINTLLLQMNTLSQKQLSLIDIMDNIQMETQGQIKQLNKRISKLEKNVEDLTNELYYLKNE